MFRCICIHWLSITVTKHLKQSAQKEGRFILAHDFRGFHHSHLALLFCAYGEAGLHSGQNVGSKTVQLAVGTGKEEKRPESCSLLLWHTSSGLTCPPRPCHLNSAPTQQCRPRQDLDTWAFDGLRDMRWVGFGHSEWGQPPKSGPAAAQQLINQQLFWNEGSQSFIGQCFPPLSS